MLPISLWYPDLCRYRYGCFHHQPCQDLYNVIIPHSRRYLKSGKEAITDEQLKQILVLSVVDSQHNIVVDLSDKDISCLVSINDNQHLSVEWDLKASKQIFDEEKGLVHMTQIVTW